jgi:hypothetical protein
MIPRNHRAVMGSRREPLNSRDHFPTPAWATRALLRRVIRPHIRPYHRCLDPCAGEGHMADALAEFFDTVFISDIHDYGYGDVIDFLDPDFWQPDLDWTIANPPFRLWLDFTRKALAMSRVGVAMLCQTRFLEGIGRYNGLFRHHPPTYVGVFVERVTMVRGRLDPSIRSATAYSWVCWVHAARRHSQIVWIPPGTRIALGEPP